MGEKHTVAIDGQGAAGRHHPGEGVEERRLPAPVGPDDAEEFAGLTDHGDVRHRLHTPEGHGDTVSLEEHR
jgi:hypothetical protein